VRSVTFVLILFGCVGNFTESGMAGPFPYTLF
jgi:hypothetical protein